MVRLPQPSLMEFDQSKIMSVFTSHLYSQGCTLYNVYQCTSMVGIPTIDVH